jgi:hypothetical protein
MRRAVWLGLALVIIGLVGAAALPRESEPVYSVAEEVSSMTLPTSSSCGLLLALPRRGSQPESLQRPQWPLSLLWLCS